MTDYERIQFLAKYFIERQATFCDMVNALTNDADDRFTEKDFMLLVDNCEFFGAISDDIMAKIENSNL